MIQCPDCRNQIPDDSAFCDQCGKELKWCPECGRPKRGTECPVCGSDLIPGRRYWAGDSSASPQNDRQGGQNDRQGGQNDKQGGQDDKSGVQRTATGALRPSALVGNGWRLTLQEGAFGRLGGIWPQLSSCPYVSGTHGQIADRQSEWILTDNGSTNGTYVNGRKLAAQEQYTLKKGDRIRIATLDFTVE